MAELFVNNARGRLLNPFTGGQTTLALRSGQGALFPSWGVGDFSWLTVEQGPADKPTHREIIRASSRSGDVITCTRAQQGTSMLNFDKGARVELRLTAQTLVTLQTSLGYNRRLPSGGFQGEGIATLDGYGNLGQGGNAAGGTRPTPSAGGGKGASLPRFTVVRYCANGATPEQNCVGTAGEAPNIGGVELLVRFTIDNDVLGTKKFLGLSNSNSASLITTSGPSSLATVSIIGFGQETTTPAGGTWFLYYNAGVAGPVTVVDTSVTKVIGHLYQLRVWSPRGQARWYAELIDLDTGSRYFDTFTSNIPTAGQQMYGTFHSHRATGTDNFSLINGWAFVW